MSRTELEAEIDGLCLQSNHIENDEYEFVTTNLERWKDRDFRAADPWRGERSAVEVWT